MDRQYLSYTHAQNQVVTENSNQNNDDSIDSVYH